MTESTRCTTHHICDCLDQRLERLEAVAKDARAVSSSYGAFVRAISSLPTEELEKTVRRAELFGAIQGSGGDLIKSLAALDAEGGKP